jgi:hypothetical protein
MVLGVDGGLHIVADGGGAFVARGGGLERDRRRPFPI